MLEVQVSDSVLTDDARAGNRQANINGAKSAPQDCRVDRRLAVRSVIFLAISIVGSIDFSSDPRLSGHPSDGISNKLTA
jgi:hypothetical protein